VKRILESVGASDTSALYCVCAQAAGMLGTGGLGLLVHFFQGSTLLKCISRHGVTVTVMSDFKVISAFRRCC
jgi:hypothetical protein